MPQHSGLEVAPAAVRIDELPVVADGHRVDGEVAPRQVLLERDVGRRVRLEPLVARPRLALGARERVFLLRLGMEEHREVLADGPEAEVDHLLGRGADDDPVAVGLQRRVGLPHLAEQRIAYAAADAEDLHQSSSVSGSAAAAATHCCIAGSANTASEYRASSAGSGIA